jgi:hypothetical protein
MPGIKDPAMPGIKDPAMPGVKDPAMPGVKDPAMPGVKDTAMPGVKDPAMQGVKDAAISLVFDKPTEKLYRHINACTSKYEYKAQNNIQFTAEKSNTITCSKTCPNGNLPLRATCLHLKYILSLALCSANM